MDTSLNDAVQEYMAAFSEPDRTVYFTYATIAINHYHELLDMAMVELRKQYPQYYEAGMNKKELAYEVIRHCHA